MDLYHYSLLNMNEQDNSVTKEESPTDHIHSS